MASALPWHGRGQGFESLMLHHKSLTAIGVLVNAVWQFEPEFLSFRRETARWGGFWRFWAGVAGGRGLESATGGVGAVVSPC